MDVLRRSPPHPALPLRGRGDQRTERFTYYPTPQITDQPKLAITREGAIWYTPRSSLKAAVGVLYPDVDRITTLAAHY